MCSLVGFFFLVDYVGKGRGIIGMCVEGGVVVVVVVVLRKRRSKGDVGRWTDTISTPSLNGIACCEVSCSIARGTAE
jgi:uncharacterized membrane protein